MSETFEQKKGLSQVKFKADSAADAVDETTPQTITGIVESFAALLGGTPAFVQVRQDQYGLYGWCSDGVLEKVKNDGGGIRFGWTIWEWPSVMLTAEFHGVWISPEGLLIDITPKPQRETQIVFVPDESYPMNFDFDDRPTNRRYRIPQEPDYRSLASAEISTMKPSQIDYERSSALTGRG
jgi:hypothetical protein